MLTIAQTSSAQMNNAQLIQNQASLRQGVYEKRRNFTKAHAATTMVVGQCLS